jgi:hypothetical protein
MHLMIGDCPADCRCPSSSDFFLVYTAMYPLSTLIGKKIYRHADGTWKRGCANLARNGSELHRILKGYLHVMLEVRGREASFFYRML